MGNRKSRNKLAKELSNKPLTLCGQPMLETEALKYLGDFVVTDLEGSVHQTVLKTVGIARHSILEIRAVIENLRAKWDQLAWHLIFGNMQ